MCTIIAAIIQPDPTQYLWQVNTAWARYNRSIHCNDILNFCCSKTFSQLYILLPLCTTATQLPQNST